MISGASEEEVIEAIGRADILSEFMPKIKQLQQENKQLRQDYAQIVSDNCDYLLLEQENQQLKANWNKLKEYIRETKFKEFEKSYGKRYGKTFTQAELIVCNMILDKMQEMEQEQ